MLFVGMNREAVYVTCYWEQNQQAGQLVRSTGEVLSATADDSISQQPDTESAEGRRCD